MQRLQRLRDNIRSVYMGDAGAVDRVIVCLLARGHILIEDVPGVGKTVLGQALARSLDCVFSRLQMTPDMLPADVLGVTIYSQDKEEFVFKPGPVFANVMLADEINRTTPRTQSALLEAMNECQVSIDGESRQLDPPFMVIATQNPYEFEGTYFLPESQMDRFLMRINLGYPSAQDEARILSRQPSLHELKDLKPVLSRADVLELQEMAANVKVDDSLMTYIVEIANATRNSDQIQVGVSPRGSLALVSVAKATALLNQRDYLVPEDITDNITAVCSHRIMARSHMHDGSPVTTERVLQQVMETVEAPS